ncbi:hypothetical protein B4V02_04435 [Paenibacillus kribbensis]|uniref:AAA+ ATPase domain-containing protein n=1 Tax=Paenibacillus kribbensis TaxID=172713 RepID=A0A222WJ16_9BACL|nr:ATP-binding cassette domain-containing protein [Paenibacillus kribbensis]ASR45988.1 hypothetical protein B4V02_04435 [Paenibacillus kribbensis]
MELTAEQMEIWIGKKEIIKNVSIRVKNQQFVGLIGPNGCGKSTLLKSIYKSLVPQKGTVFLDDMDVLKTSEKKVSQQMGVVSQFNEMHFDLTVQQMVMFNDSMKMVKLNNIFEGETGQVNLETLINADPDVLIIPDWSNNGGTTPDAIKQALYANSKLSSMKAIKNKQIYAVDYNYMFGYGYNTIDGMEILAKEMYPDLFK